VPTQPPTHHIIKRDAADVAAERSQRDKDRWKRSDEQRGSAHQRGYGAKWSKVVAGYKRSHPLCVAHEANGFVVPVEVVDHIMPARLDQSQFWVHANWQSLCRDCHQRIKAILEQRYELGEIDAKDLRLDRELPEFFISVL